MMSLTINTNVSALVAQRNLNNAQDKLSTTLNRLSSGLRVNNAKDDAAGLAIAEGMSSRIRGLTQGARNGNDGISLIQTAESGMNQTLSLLQRMRELASQGSTGTYSSGDLANMDVEFQALNAEIDRVASTAEFNNIALMSGGSVSVQVGSANTANDRLSITLSNTSTSSLSTTSASVTSNTNAQAALTLLDAAITTVTSGLAQLGASQSNIESAVSGNDDRVTRLEAARSRIMDTDYASESSNLARYQILQQSGAAMLSQANSSGQIVLKLLQ